MRCLSPLALLLFGGLLACAGGPPPGAVEAVAVEAPEPTGETTPILLLDRGISVGVLPPAVASGGGGLALRDQADGTVLLYGLDPLEARGAWPSLSPFAELAVGPAGDRVVAVGEGGLVWARVGDPEARRVPREALWSAGAQSFPGQVAWEAEGRSVLVAGRGLSRVPLDPPGPAEAIALPEGASPVALTPTGQGTLVGLSEGGVVLVPPGATSPSITVPPGPEALGRVRSVALSPDGAMVARLHVGKGHHVRVSTLDGTEVLRLSVGMASDHRLVWQEAGLFLLRASGTVRVDLEAGELVPLDHPPARAVGLGPEGELLVVEEDGGLRLGDRHLPGRSHGDWVNATSEGGLRFGLPAGWLEVGLDAITVVRLPLDSHSAAETPRGPAVLGYDGRIALYEPDGGLRAVVEPRKGVLEDLVLGPDQASLMVGGDQGQVRWVDLEGASLGERSLPRDWDVASSVAWSSDELGVAVLTDGGRLFVVEPTAAEAVERLVGISGPRDLAWGPGASGLAVAARGGVEVPPGEPAVVVVEGAVAVAWSPSGRLAWADEDGLLWADGPGEGLDGEPVPGVLGARGLTWFRTPEGRELLAWAGTVSGIADPATGVRALVLPEGAGALLTADCVLRGAGGDQALCRGEGGAVAPRSTEVTGLRGITGL